MLVFRAVNVRLVSGAWKNITKNIPIPIGGVFFHGDLTMVFYRKKMTPKNEQKTKITGHRPGLKVTFHEKSQEKW